MNNTVYHYIPCVLEYKVCRDLLFPLTSYQSKAASYGTAASSRIPVLCDVRQRLAQCSRRVLRRGGTRQNTAIYGHNNIHGPKHVICISSGLSSSVEGTLHSGCMGAHNKLGFLTAGHISLSYSADPHSSRTQPV